MKYLKSLITFTILITTLTISAQSNLSGIVYYESTVNQKKVDNYLKKERDSIINNNKGRGKSDLLIKMLDATYLNVTPILSKIIFNNGEGQYKLEPNLNLDESDIGHHSAKTKAGGFNEYYYNIKENTYLIKECALGDCFIFPNEYLEWQLTQESKTINGFKVFKATRGEGKVTAWYTPNIPVNFGPKGEYGLPGLILELEFSQTIFRATKIELNPEKKVKVKAPTKGKLVTLEEYTEIMDKARRSVFGNR
jgi:GLPGLI family protein